MFGVDNSGVFNRREDEFGELLGDIFPVDEDAEGETDGDLAVWSSLRWLVTDSPVLLLPIRLLLFWPTIESMLNGSLFVFGLMIPLLLLGKDIDDGARGIMLASLMNQWNELSTEQQTECLFEVRITEEWT